MVNVIIMQIYTTLYTQHCYYEAGKHFQDKSRFLSRNNGANGNVKDTNLIERVHAVCYINYGAKHTEKAMIHGRANRESRIISGGLYR